MSRLKRLIHEIHRRSLWQVLSVYLVSSWIALQVADTVTAALGLPDWVPQLALVLLIVLLPVVLATAFVQEGVGGARAEPVPEAERMPEVPAPEPLGAHHRVFTWRNAIAAAVALLALLTVSAGGYMGLRAAGIGPFATLMSKGLLEERDRIVLADFENRTPDSLLAIAATELFRTALSQSLVVNVADPEYVAGVLRRMEREPGTPLNYDVAREIAIREGLKAVVSGEIISVGAGYVVSARLVSAAEGGELWADSETARDSEALFDAIDALSRRLRERIGESLKTIRPTEPLWEVTTSSLDALKKFIQAYRARNQEGDYARSIALFEEAIRLDTTFAMAHFGLGVSHMWADNSRSHWAPAVTKAFELRGRLPDGERYYIEGSYYHVVTEELDKAVTAWRALKEINPDFNPNNLALVYRALRDFEQSEPIFHLVIESDSLDATGYMNLIPTQVALGKTDDARITLARFGEMLPDHPSRRGTASDFAAVQGDYDEAERHLKAWRGQFREDPSAQANTGERLATLARLRGRLAEAENYLDEVVRIQEEQGRTVDLINNSAVLGRSAAWFRGDTAAALRRMEAALDRWPLDSIPLDERPYFWLVALYAWAGEPEQAKVYLAGLEAQSEFMGRRSFEIFRRYALGNIAMAEGRQYDAIEEYRRAYEYEMCTMCAFGPIAFSYDQAGEPDSALVYYERYVTTPWLWRLSHDSYWLALAHERLGDLYEQRGDTVKAIYYYGKLVDLWKDADPELQPRVEAARRAIEALSPDT